MEEDSTVKNRLSNQGVLPPSEELHNSTVLNGIGNGLMLGAVPFVVLKTGAQLAGKKFPLSGELIDRVGTFGSIIGSVMGAVYGMSEAKHAERYRRSVKNSITQLSGDLAEANSKIDALTQAVNAKAAAEPAR